MKTKLTSQYLVTLFVFTALIVFFHILFKYISITIFDDKHGFLFELSNRLDLNDEMSVPQWFTQLIFLLIGSVSFIAYKLTTKSQGKYFWLAGTAVGILMSLDDVATLHEFILQSLHNRYFIDQESTIFTNAWMIILPFIVIALLAFCYWAFRVLPHRTTAFFVVGGFIFLTGAVIVDSLTNFYSPNSFMARGVMAGIEGGLQMIGSGIVLYAGLDYLDKFYKQPIKRAWSNISSSERRTN